MKGMKKLLIGLFLVASLVACEEDASNNPATNIVPVDFGSGTEFLVGVQIGLKVVYDDGAAVKETVTWSVTGDSFVLDMDSDQYRTIVKAVKVTGATTVTAKYTLADKTEVVRTVSISPSATAPTKVVIAGKNGIAMETELIKPSGSAGSTAVELMAYYGAEGPKQLKANVTNLATWTVVNTPATADGVTVDKTTSMLNVTAASTASRTNVTATYPVGNLTDDADLTIASKAISNLFIVLKNSDINAVPATQVDIEKTTQLLAYAIYDSAGYPKPIYSGIKWISTVPVNATVDPNTGIVTGVKGVQSSSITVESLVDGAITSSPISVGVTPKNSPLGNIELPTTNAVDNRILVKTNTQFTMTVDGNPVASTVPVTWSLTNVGTTNAKISESGVFTADTASDSSVVVHATIAAGAMGNDNPISGMVLIYVVTENKVAGSGTSNTNISITSADNLVAGNSVSMFIIVTYTTEPTATVYNPEGLVYSLAPGAGTGWAIDGSSVTVGEVGTSATFIATIGDTSNNKVLTAVAPTLQSVTAVRPAAYPAAPAPLVLVVGDKMTLTTVAKLNNGEVTTPTTTTWESRDRAVASVTNAGVVTGVIVTGGKTTITPTSDGISGSPATVHVVPAP